MASGGEGKLRGSMKKGAGKRFDPSSSGHEDLDAAYFRYYSHLGVHEEMIKDRIRTNAYRDAIFQHSDMIRNKVVLDVGCGTGILSIFCADAGARKVYAIEASDIAVQARRIVKANQLSEKITIILGRVEDVEIDEDVDVIVSEWMGYMLLYESMLASVIFARDRWLKPGGIMLPSFATLYFAPITNNKRYADSIDFWRNVYGIDSKISYCFFVVAHSCNFCYVSDSYFNLVMQSKLSPVQNTYLNYLEFIVVSAMLPLAKQASFEEPCVETITLENVLSRPIVVRHIDCSTVTIEELQNLKEDFHVEALISAPLHGFAFWFDVTFGDRSTATSDTQSDSGTNHSFSGNFERDFQSEESKKREERNPIVLSTAPENLPTHWQQTVLYRYDPIEVEQHQVIKGSLSLSQNKEHSRFLNIHLEYTCGDQYYVKECVMH